MSPAGGEVFFLTGYSGIETRSSVILTVLFVSFRSKKKSRGFFAVTFRSVLGFAPSAAVPFSRTSECVLRRPWIDVSVAGESSLRNGRRGQIVIGGRAGEFFSRPFARILVRRSEIRGWEFWKKILCLLWEKENNQNVFMVSKEHNAYACNNKKPFLVVSEKRQADNVLYFGC